MTKSLLAGSQNNSVAKSRSVLGRSTALVGVGLALALGAASLLPTEARAQSLFWDGTDTTANADGGAGTWDAATTTNWDTAATGGANSLWVDNSIAVFGGVGGTVTIDAGARVVNGITFDAAGYVLDGPGAISLGSINTPFTVNADATINAVIQNGGGSSLEKLGSGILTLGGANTYNTGTTISAGTLRLGAAGVLADAGPLTINGGTFDLNGFTETVGNLSGAGGTISIGTGGRLVVVQGADAAFAGNFAGTGDGFGQPNAYFEKQGASTLTLSGTNTITGPAQFEISNGRVVLAGGNAIGDQHTVGMNIAGSLELAANHTETIALILAVPGAQVVLNNGSTLILGGIGGPAGAPTSNYTTSGAGNFEYSADGIDQTFNVALGHTGTTTISGGTFRYGANDIIADASAATVSGGTMALGAFNDTLASLSLQGGSITGTGTLTSLADFDIRAGSASAILAGGVGLNKTTAGTATLTGANTYTGSTTVSAGTLALTGAGSIASTTVDVTGGTLRSDGGALATGSAITLSAATSVLDIDGSETLGAGSSLALNTAGASVDIAAGGVTLAVGTIDTAAGTTINVGAGSTLQGLSNTINNGGVMNVADGGSVTDVGAINNLATGVYNFAGSGTLDSDTDADTDGPVTNDGQINLNGTNVQVVNIGPLGNNDLINQVAGQVNVNAGRLDVAGALTNSSPGAAVGGAGGVDIAAGGILNVAGALANNTGGEIANIGGTLNSNGGQIANASGATLTSTGTVTGGVVNDGVVNAAGTFSGVILNQGAGDFNVTGALVGNSTFDNTGTATLDVTGGNFTGITTLTNNSAGGDGAGGLGGVNIAGGTTLSAAAVINNTPGEIVNAGTLTSVAAIDNNAGATLTTTGTVNGGAVNDGVINASGAFNGAIVNQGAGDFNVTGALVGNSTFDNTGTATLDVTGGDFTGVTTLTNNSTAAAGVTIAATRTLSATNVTNAAGATIANSGTLTSANVIANAGTLNNLTAGSVINGGLNNTNVASNAGTVNGGLTNSGTYTQSGGSTNGGTTNTGVVNANGGAFSGAIANNAAGDFNVGGNVTADNTFTNNGTATLDVTGGDFTGITTLTNNSTAAAGVTIAATRTLSATNVTNAPGATIANSGTLTSANVIANAGTLNNLGAGSILNGGLNNTNVASNAGTVNGGLTNSGTYTQSGGSTNGGTTNAGVVNANGGAFNGAISNSGAGSFNVGGAVTSDSGFVNGATLAVGAAGNYAIAGLLTNNASVTVADGGVLTAGGLAGATAAANVAVAGPTGSFSFGADNTSQTYAGIFTGSGIVNKNGTGVQTLTGANTAANSFSGTFNVNGGSLLVNGTLGDLDPLGGLNQAVVNVNNTGLLGGVGTIAGNVNVNNGGTLSAGVSPGTLTILGNLALNAGSTSNFELGQAGVPNGANNDLIVVGGTATLGGTANLTAVGGGQILSGYYQLMQVAGGASGNFATVNAGAATASVYITTNNGAGGPDNVNALIAGTGQNVQFWDGADQLGLAGVGGAGTWDAASTNWATTPTGGPINDIWRSDVGIFAGAGGAVTVSGTQNFEGVQFTSNGYVLSGGALNMTGNTAPGGNAAASFITVDAGVSTTINSVLSGVGLDKVLGSGTLILGGANTYVGTTTVTTGTLQLAGAGTLGNVANSVVVNGAGAVLDLGGTTQTQATATLTDGTIQNGSLNVATYNQAAGTLAAGTTVTATTAFNLTNAGTLAGNLAGAGALTKSGAGTAALSGTNTYTGATTINAGVLSLAGGAAIADVNAVTVNAGGALDLQASETIGSLAGAGNVTLNANTLTTGGNNASTAFSGVMSGTGGLTKAGTGAFTLSAANTYTGATTVNAGLLDVTGSVASSVVTVNGGTLQVDGASLLDTASVTLNAGTLALTGSETIGSLAGAAGSTVTLAANTLTTGGNNASTAFAGAISGTGGLTKVGTGTFTLSGANTYTGATAVSGGRLQLQGGAALADTNQVTVANGAVLELLSPETIGLLSGAGNVELNANTLSTGGAGDSLFSGVISGTGGLTKLGASTFTLTGANTLTGLTDIQAGAIALASASVAGPVTVRNGGSLLASGTSGVGTLTLNSGSTLSMVNGVSGERLNVNGNLVVDDGSNMALNVDLGGTVGIADNLAVTGNTSGTGTINFVSTNTIFGLQAAPTVVIAAGGVNDVDFDPSRVSGLPSGGLVQYEFVQDANQNWVINSSVNVSAAASIGATIGTTQALIGTVVNRPSTAFVASLAEPEANECGTAAWMRATGGAAEAEAGSIATSSGGVSIADNTELSLTYGGAQVSFDFGCLNIKDEGANVNVGLTAGYNFGDTSQNQPNRVPGGLQTITDIEFESRFVGVYATYSKGAFSAEVQARGDFSNFEIVNSSLPGVAGTTVKTDRYTVSGSASYDFTLAEAYRLTPQVGFSLSKTSSESLNFGAARFDFEDTVSALGLVSLSLARTFVLPDEVSAIQPFVTGTLYHDFGDDFVTVFTDQTTGQTQRIVTENLGTFGEFSLGVGYGRIFEGEDGTPRELSASVRGDVRVGDRLLSGGLTAQIRLQF